MAAKKDDMAAKKDFDLVQLAIGYRKFAVPKDVAMAFWDLMSNAEVYELESTWKTGGSVSRAKHIGHDSMPSISSLSIVLFHTMLANQETWEAEEMTKEMEKEKAKNA